MGPRWLIANEPLAFAHLSASCGVAPLRNQADKGGAKAIPGTSRIHHRHVEAGDMVCLVGAKVAGATRPTFNHHMLHAAFQ